MNEYHVHLEQHKYEAIEREKRARRQRQINEAKRNRKPKR